MWNDQALGGETEPRASRQAARAGLGGSKPGRWPLGLYLQTRLGTPASLGAVLCWQLLSRQLVPRTLNLRAEAGVGVWHMGPLPSSCPLPQSEGRGHACLQPTQASEGSHPHRDGAVTRVGLRALGLWGSHFRPARGGRERSLGSCPTGHPGAGLGPMPAPPCIFLRRPGEGGPGGGSAFTFFLVLEFSGVLICTFADFKAVIKQRKVAAQA